MQLLLINGALILIGLFALYKGGDVLVDGASLIARRFKVPAIVIGLTVVAFGTSAPELFVSMISAFRGNMSISMGNVIGSNIANIALILGLASILHPIVSSKAALYKDMMVMFLGYVLVIIFILNPSSPDWISGGIISRVEGFGLVAILVTYTWLLYRNSRKAGIESIDTIDTAELEKIESEKLGPLWVDLLKIAGGIAALAIGSEALIRGATWYAINIFGVSERFVGLTIVALGTSLPELVTSLVAVLKKEMDISLGNIIGSNIFNTLMVLGATALARPILIVDASFGLDALVMFAVSVALLLFVVTIKKIPRWGGALLLAGYIGYIGFLVSTSGV